jgi:EAL domain-containing protein (putative c-di-GMP-specific phosphodiesterase class I)/ActR/RegA family two-component response regulator
VEIKRERELEEVSSMAEAPCRGRVLVADDDEQVLRTCERVLTAAGFQVTAAWNGSAARQQFTGGSFDAVVSDISMPEMSGIELLKEIRTRDLDVPVLLMTAFPTTDTAIAALEGGALGYLKKPFDGKALVDGVSRAVRLHRLACLKREAANLDADALKQFGDRAGLEVALESALASMWVAFQPVVRWSSQEVFAYEALMRTKELRLPHPGAVIGAAERLGRLSEVGRAVRMNVARVMHQSPVPLLFVNLHAHDLLDDELYSSDAPLSSVASNVVLEITERVSLEDIKDCEARVNALRKQGFRFAIDDLGAGYAGLSSFAQLEPEVVKFDMSLVRNIDASATKRRLIRSMSTLFKEMDILVVAEGVETPRERDSLIATGCDLFQGYLFARPDRGFPQPRW